MYQSQMHCDDIIPLFIEPILNSRVVLGTVKLDLELRVHFGKGI